MSKPPAPILHVEDSPQDVYLLQYAFRRAAINIPIQVVTDGEAAICYLAGNGKYADRAAFPLPALVLLDLKLPHKMGLDVLKWIRQQSQLRSLIVIILTASINERDITQAYQLGANAFLVKPSSAQVLTDMCQALNLFWLTHNTFPTEPAGSPSVPHGEIL